LGIVLELRLLHWEKGERFESAAAFSGMVMIELVAVSDLDILVQHGLVAGGGHWFNASVALYGPERLQ